MTANKRDIFITAVTAFLLVCFASLLSAQEYKQYRSNQNMTELFELTFDDKYLEVAVPSPDGFSNQRYVRNSITSANKSVSIDGVLLFDENGFNHENKSIDYSKISDIRVESFDDYTVITFYSRPDSKNKVLRRRRGNLVRPFENIQVENEDYIRGFVLSIGGNISIDGEVNEDVISLFGNVTVNDKAVVRGDIVSFGGNVILRDEATVYGEVYTGEDRSGRKHRRWKKNNEGKVGLGFGYDRVDGAAPYLNLGYDHKDSLYPSIWAKGGYGFASERWRYEFGLRQTILRSLGLSIGGSIFRNLVSEDDWLLGDDENIIFTLLATEDFKDYYESEGGEITFGAAPIKNVDIGIAYRYEETMWLNSHPELWSMFGGSKRFAPNFSSVDSTNRKRGIGEIDSLTNATITTRVEFSNRDKKKNRFSRSSWTISGWLEWSHPDLESDYDYRRYMINVQRYQQLRTGLMLISRSVVGWSDGYLPMHKQFYLGGLGTLRGMKHKEMSGTRFWMNNLEYRFSPPKFGMAFSVLWDVARISKMGRFGSDDDVKHSLGAAVYVADDFRISVAKRLDRSSDDDLQLYVRFSKAI